MPGLSFYERQHLEKLIQQEASLKNIFDEYVRNVSTLMSGWQNSGNENVWIRNADIEKGVEKELQVLHSKLTENIKNYSIDAWNRSNKKTDDLIEAYIKDIPLNSVTKKGLFARNEQALEAFLKAKIDGETISDRVWKVTGGGKEAIEHYLSSGISTGRPATVISQDMRQLLQNPDKRFKRIRNEEGKLVMSAPMKDYHPGTGVYRSSFMNAKRLAVSRTNAAYRTADCDRWEKLDFVLGIEVRRSASNKGPCPICDALVGKYPKDFKYQNWHPFCICVATPILMDEDAFIDSLVDGTAPKGDFVQDIPAGAREYMEGQLNDRKVSIKSYLFQNNKRYFLNKGIETGELTHNDLATIFINERNKNKRIEFMSPLTVDSLKDSKIFMINNGNTGCIIAQDGDLQNVFNNAGKGQGARIINLAIKNGATKLDCFANFLPEYYSQFGFKEVSRIKWDDKYAPKNWDYKKNGKPDVVFMKLFQDKK